MSLSELNRLREAIKSNPGLAGSIKQKMQEGGATAAASYVHSLGYDVSANDVSELIASGEELSEHELELVSGGSIHGQTQPTTVNAVPGGPGVSGGTVTGGGGSSSGGGGSSSTTSSNPQKKGQ